MIALSEQQNAAARKSLPPAVLPARVHLIGIGGCGMRGAAAMLARLGASVSGSDLTQFAGMGELVSRGAVVHVGHSPANVPVDTQQVVVSAAVPADNPELCEARDRGIPVITYAELVGLLMSAYTGVSVAGTHGKSTTSALTAYIYHMAGLDPSFLIGADCAQLGGGSGVGDGEHFIVESCEYARSFLHQRPSLAAVLNIEPDHLDCYADLRDIVSAFAEFVGNVPASGTILAFQGDLAATITEQSAAARVETFGLEPGATWQATNLRINQGRYAFTISYQDQPLIEATLRLAGQHNVTNALAATALAWHGGAPADAIAQALSTFEGIDRRMSLRGQGGGVTIVDDYAHHPTEIVATLAALRSQYEPRRVWVVFQPHQHSRTRLLMDDFARSFAAADLVLVPDIYSARDSEDERRLTGSGDLVARMQAAGCAARYLPTLAEVSAHLIEELADGDLLVTMGAGDVWKVADEVVDRVGRSC